MDAKFGSAGASSGANTALSAMSTSTTMLTSPIGLFSSRLNSDTFAVCSASAGDTSSGLAGSVRGVCSLMTDALSG